MTDPSDAAPAAKKPAPGKEMPLPHDRDEQAATTKTTEGHTDNRAAMRQAHRDVEAGVMDTERIGTPNDVPSADRNRE